MPRKSEKFSTHAFGYPIYVVECVGSHSVIIAGGGGAAKTGVPNRIDIVNICKDLDKSVPVVETSGGLDTGTDAVMNLTVCNTSGSGSFFTSLEGRTCVNYFTSLKNLRFDDSQLLWDIDHPQSTTDDHIGYDTLDSSIRKRKVESSSKTTRIANPKTSADEGDAEVDFSEPGQWDVIKMHQLTMPALDCENGMPQTNSSLTSLNTPNVRASLQNCSGMPTCVTSGGPANFWFAVGTDSGSVLLFDRTMLVDSSGYAGTASVDLLKPFSVYPDTSVGLSVGVSALALTTTDVPKSESNEASNDVGFTALLATICEQPSWNLVHVWSVFNFSRSGQSIAVKPTLKDGSRDHKSKSSKRKSVSSPTKAKSSRFFLSVPPCSETLCNTEPYAVASYSSFMATSPLSNRPTYRFKHCQFLRSNLNDFPTSEFSENDYVRSSFLLVTTMQPLCANRKSISRLIVWPVPVLPCPDKSKSVTADKSPISLIPLTDVALPQGDLPACLTVHPNRMRNLIGLGTMEGRVLVYFLSPRTQTLSCVYKITNAHPIFVTALTFLPLPVTVFKNLKNRHMSLHEPSYELVSVSVDRMLRWHPGPSYIQINRLLHGCSPQKRHVCDQVRRCLKILAIYLTLVFVAPVLLVLFGQVCYTRI